MQRRSSVRSASPGSSAPFVAPPVPLLQAATVANEGPWPQSLLASRAHQVYLKLGPPSGSAVGSAYYPIVHLSGPGGVPPGGSSRCRPQLHDNVDRAARPDPAGGDGRRRSPAVSIAFRTPGPAGRRVQAGGHVPGCGSHLRQRAAPDAPEGSVSLLLPAASCRHERPQRAASMPVRSPRLRRRRSPGVRDAGRRFSELTL